MTFPSPLSRQEGADHYIAEGSYGLMSTIERKSGYVDWGQVAGNFDGDGSVIPVIEYHSLLFHLTWSDAYLPQVEQLKTFLEQEIIERREIGISVIELIGRYGVSKDTIYKVLKKHGK
jgi:hypothetical protein